jgi:hypothetical protein
MLFYIFLSKQSEFGKKLFRRNYLLLLWLQVLTTMKFWINMVFSSFYVLKKNLFTGQISYTNLSKINWLCGVIYILQVLRCKVIFRSKFFFPISLVLRYRGTSGSGFQTWYLVFLGWFSISLWVIWLCDHNAHIT